MTRSLSDKRALFVVAHEVFRDEEYDVPRRKLEENGVQVTVASWELGEATGRFGLKAPVDILLKDAAGSDYDAVVFIGGGGAEAFFQDPEAHRVIREADEAGAVVAAICIAPRALAEAGVLTGKRATSFPSQAGALKSLGVQYTGGATEVDGRYVTADGPESAEEFGELLIEKLTSPRKDG
jgi:protease I